MIAGYVKMGDEITIEANASISNRVEIGEHAAVLSGSVVTKNVDANQVVSGNFAVDRRKHEAYLAGRS
jgi:UDP-3-O-[3-hydroxymyristoyl] glucosamine N-acyltransferase